MTEIKEVSKFDPGNEEEIIKSSSEDFSSFINYLETLYGPKILVREVGEEEEKPEKSEDSQDFNK